MCDGDDEIFAKLEVFEDYGIEMTISDMPKVKVKSPRLPKERLRDMAEFWAGDPMYHSSTAWLEEYSEGMNRQIISQLQEIRKSIKRIQGFVYCIKTSEQIIAELKNEH